MRRNQVKGHPVPFSTSSFVVSALGPRGTPTYQIKKSTRFSFMKTTTRRLPSTNTPLGHHRPLFLLPIGNANRTRIRTNSRDRGESTARC